MSVVTLFLALAFVQNLVLNTGIGASVLVRMSKKRRNIGTFSIWLTVFAVLTMLIVYPLDKLIGTDMVAKWLRPLMIIAVTAALYVATVLVLRRWRPAWYDRFARVLPMAAFNNVVIGIVLIVNHQFALSLGGALGVSLGACVGFFLLALLTAEGIQRLDNPGVPKAFRGLPVALLYLGVLALALMGFAGSVPLL